MSEEGFNGQFCIPLRMFQDSTFEKALVDVNKNLFSDIDFNVGQNLEYTFNSGTFNYEHLPFKKCS